MSQPTENIHLSSFPQPLSWYGSPESWNLSADSTLSITSGQKTDWFIDPNTGKTTHNAPALLSPPQAGACQFMTHVTVDHAATFDAGTLVVHQSPQVWGKLALERSPQGQLMIVSVITRGISDDCNSVIVDGNSIYLRLSKLDRAYAFHYSHDGRLWHMVRHFALGEAGSADGDRIGFLVQSPTGEGCAAHFSQIAYVPQKLADLRSGE